MLELIRNDHKNLAILIKLLQEKLERVKQDLPIDYALIRDVVEYMQEYADRYHHRYEDVVYGYYLKKIGASDSPIHRLEEEHHKIADDTASFRELIEMILLDSVVPRETFAARLAAFIDQQRRHMEYENREILPLLERDLTAADWAEIDDSLPPVAGSADARATVQRIDPLFGNEVAQRYRDLALRLQRASR